MRPIIPFVDSSNQYFINAFFSAFKQKIDRLQELRKTYPDEAFTLCLVYIDRLASGHFGGKEGQNRRNFWRALASLSGNPLFAMIHPRRLKELTERYCPLAVPFISSLINRQPNALLHENDIAAEIRQSSLLDSEKRKLVENLWRASMANIAYDFIRVAEVHGPGSGGLSFDESNYQGGKGVTLSFEMFYDALQQIHKQVTEASLTTGHWFGNPDY
mgnify:CR=1 FL=1